MVMTIPTKPPTQKIHDSLMSFFFHKPKNKWKKTESCAICFDPGATVDGGNPAPPRMMIIPLFMGFSHPKWCRISFHQQ